jgi:UDP-glucose 4-epimerase
MRRALAEKRLRFHVGDVRDPASVREAMRGVDYVFHAAALKQVPSCEFHPMEAIKTNVLGAENVLNAVLDAEVRACVVLSTDKAVYPINAMGMTKALMEKLMVAKSRLASPGGTVLCATRYGNVMGSRGSVIPHFVSQVHAGRALTVTDPDMTRFMLSLEDSVDLVLTAFEHARGGDIFVRKAPACRIGDLAQAVTTMLGSSDAPEVIGTRHGEKLYETLVSREEMAAADDLGKYYRIPADNRDLNYDLYFNSGSPNTRRFDDYTSHNTEQLDVPAMMELLARLRLVTGAANA